jgi:hypothetical protein
MIGVVAHDAGGAEIIASYILQKKWDCQYHINGAAKGVFSRKIGRLESRALPGLVEDCEWLLCGTSFLSELEWTAIGLARKKGKKSVAVLDHWTNYRQRFFRKNVGNFPDEVWVGDRWGYDLAKKNLPEVDVKLFPNPYFAEIQRETLHLPREAKSAEGLRVLYVCEPLREDGITLHGNPLYWGYTEEEAVRYFLNNLSKLGPNIEKVILRPHPQEEIGKYDWVPREFKGPIFCREPGTLIEQIHQSDIVVGCATMAMVVGLIMGKRVVSCIPPGGKAEPLPHPEIEKIEDLELS